MFIFSEMLNQVNNRRILYVYFSVSLADLLGLSRFVLKNISFVYLFLFALYLHVAIKMMLLVFNISYSVFSSSFI